MRPAARTVAVVLLGVLSIAATRFVAMRVDLEPLRPEGDATAAVLVVQVAPEDRARIGRNAWLEGEIRRGDAVVARLARAAELDSGGAVRLEMTLPPGVYDVRVELRSGSGRDSGLWEGRLTVPRLERSVEPTPPPPPPPLLTPSPVASEPLDAEPAPEVSEAGPGGVDAEPAAIAAAPEPPEVIAPTTGPRTPLPVATPAPAMAEPTAPEPVPPASGAAGAAAGPPAVPPTPEAAEIVVPPTETPPVAPAATPTPARDLGGWGAERPGLTDLTVIVTSRDRPVLGLGARDLTVEVDGREVVVEQAGGSGEAPLLLGVAVDAGRALAEELAEVRSLVGRLSLRAAGGRGDLFVVRSDGGARVVAGWGATPEDVAAALAEPGEGDASDVADLVTEALARFDGRSGRKVLLVVVGGGDTASRSDWREAADAAESAGVPVLVVGFKGESLDDRTRSALERVSDLSGGRDYWLTLRDTGLLNLVAEFYGDLLDASYALRFRHPAPGRAERVKVEVGGRDTEVRHSRQIR